MSATANIAPSVASNAAPSLPPGACDTHSHVYGDPRKYPLPPGHEACRAYDMSAYLGISESLGVQRHVLVQAKVYGTDPACLLDALAHLGPARARGIIFSDATLDAAQLARLHAQGIRGVRYLYGPGQEIDEVAVRRTAAQIAPFGWSLLMQAQPEALMPAYGWLARLPVPVVIDHLGRLGAEVGLRDAAFLALRAFLADGGWIKLAAPYYGSADGAPLFHTLSSRIDSLLAVAGDRAIWGMNWPHPNLPEDGKPDEAASLRSLLDLLPQAAVRQAIFVDNPARLYGFALE